MPLLLQCWIMVMSMITSFSFTVTGPNGYSDTFGLTDLLFPDRLWAQAIKNLPATRWHVCVGAAGGRVSRRRLYRAASVGYLGNIFNSQFGLAVRIAAQLLDLEQSVA